jgi:hypothetical protein
MELPSCNPFGMQNFDVAPRFFKKCAPLRYDILQHLEHFTFYFPANSNNSMMDT